MIVFDRVTKFFPTRNGRKYILRDVSLTLPTGTNVGVIGPNGAGKTTLIRLICGVDLPNAGRIETSYFLSWPMGIAGGLQPTMSGRENARFVCRILGVPEDEIGGKLAFVRQFAEIGDDFELPVRTYSSGMRSRLNFAVSMAFDFDCYIVDELTAVGDQRFRQKSREVFAEKRGKACFVKVSHNMKEIREECDSVIFLNGGNLYFFPDASEGIAQYQAVVKGEEPVTLAQHLAASPPRPPGRQADWVNRLVSKVSLRRGPHRRIPPPAPSRRQIRQQEGGPRQV